MNRWPFPALDKPARQPRPMPGRGTLLTLRRSGFLYSTVPSRGKFAHPFKPTLSGRRITLSRGLINEQFEPKINGVPIGGDATKGKAQPSLLLDPGMANAAGISWVCVEVEPDDTGDLLSTSRIEIVQTNQPRSIDPKVGRKALVQIAWAKNTPRAFEIVMFNLVYLRVIPVPGGGAVKHLFL